MGRRRGCLQFGLVQVFQEVMLVAYSHTLRHMHCDAHAHMFMCVRVFMRHMHCDAHAHMFMCVRVFMCMFMCMCICPHAQATRGECGALLLSLAAKLFALKFEEKQVNLGNPIKCS